jgi:hypothetical protein
MTRGPTVPGCGGARTRGRTRARALATLGLAFALASCTTDPLGAPLAAVVRIDVTGAPADGVMLPGWDRTLVATAIGPNDMVMDDVELEWSSSDAEIATVDGAGNVEAVAPGEVSIRVKAEGLTEVVPLSVREGTTIPNGGTRTVTLIGGRLRLSIPSSAGPSGTVIHARRALAWPANARILAGSVMEIGPDGIELVNPITAGITFTLAEVPASDRPALRLHALDAQGQWVELPNGSVDLNNLRVNASLQRLTKVAVFLPE